MKERIIINNQLVAYDCFQGKKTALNLVFLHGWRSQKEVWMPVIDKLSVTNNQLSVYLLDLPGFGGSPIPNSTPPLIPAPRGEGKGGGWTVGDYAEVVKGFIEKLRLKNNIIIGHSFGGRIGIRLAATKPELIRKLVLVDSAGIRDKQAKKTVLKLLAKTVRPIFVPKFMQGLRKKIYQKIGADDYLATPELQKTFINIINEDLTEDMKKIKLPTLIIWGDQDRETPIEYGRKMNELIEGSKLEILKGAGHFSFLDKPEEFVSQLLNFING